MKNEHKVIIKSVLASVFVDVLFYLGIKYIKKKKIIFKFNLKNIIDEEVLMILGDSEDTW